MQDTPKNTPIMNANAISSDNVSHTCEHDSDPAGRRRQSGERPPGRNWLNEKRMLNGRGKGRG